MATLPEFGGQIKENFDWEHNKYDEVWDCNANLLNMEVIHNLKGKA